MTIKERLHYLHRRLRYANRSEPETIHFIREFVNLGDRVLDVGANKGIITWFLAKAVGLDGEVLAFEPQPELILALEDIKSTYGLSQIENFNVGLAETPGVLPLFREYVGSTGTMVGPNVNTTESIPVEIVTLDSVLDGHKNKKRVSFVKCDVDGFEMQVFAGATRMLATDKPVLLIEIDETEVAEMTKFLADHGYRDFWFYFRKRLYPGSMSGEIEYRHAAARYRNFLFLHESDPQKDALSEISRRTENRI